MPVGRGVANGTKRNRGAHAASRCCIGLHVIMIHDMPPDCTVRKGRYQMEKKVTTEEKNNKTRTHGAHIAAATRRITALAMLTAISVVVGILCKNAFTFMIYYRFTLENIGVIAAGVFFGPAAGAMVGFASDAISCLLSTNPQLNPVISLGAITVGVTSGFAVKLLSKVKPAARYVIAVASAHVLGQVLIKSVGKMIYFGMPWYGIFIGLAFSVLAGSVEYMIILMLSKNKQISEFLK